MKYFRATIGILVSMLLSSCASTKIEGPAFDSFADIKNDYALVYFMRPRRKYGELITPDIYINEEKLLGLKSGGFSFVYIPAGKYVLTAMRKQLTKNVLLAGINLEISANERYFLTFLSGHGGGGGLGVAVVSGIPVPSWDNVEGGFSWRETSQSNANNFLMRLRYIAPENEILD